MTYPHRTYYDDEDLDMDVGAAEDNALARAVQNSLETFAQSEETAQIPGDTREFPQSSFSADQIAEDERRRERELYGPSNPPRTSRVAHSLNETPEPLTTARDKTNNNSENKATEYLDKASKNTSENDYPNSALNQELIKMCNKGIVKHFLAMKGASGEVKSLSHSDEIIAIQIGASFNTICCPASNAHLETLSITDSESDASVDSTNPHPQGAKASSAISHASRGQHRPYPSTDDVAGSESGQNPPVQAAETAGVPSPRGLAQSQSAADSAVEQLVIESEDKIGKEDGNAAATGSKSDVQGSPPPDGAGAASDVADGYIESGPVGEHFDSTIARAHAARLAAIEAALDSQDAGLGPALGAARARVVTRGAIAAGSAPAAADEELECFLNEAPVSPHVGSEEDRPFHQKTPPQ